MKVNDFLVPSRDVTNQTLPGGNNLIFPGQGEFGNDILGARDEKIGSLFYSVVCRPLYFSVNLPVDGEDPVLFASAASSTLKHFRVKNTVLNVVFVLL